MAGNQITIGAPNYQAGEAPNYFFGQIDEIALWDTELSAAEVAEIYNNGISRNANINVGSYISSSSLVAYWRFNEESGNTVQDVSINSNTGIINGGASRVANGITVADYYIVVDTYREVAINPDPPSDFMINVWYTVPPFITGFTLEESNNYVDITINESTYSSNEPWNFPTPLDQNNFTISNIQLNGGNAGSIAINGISNTNGGSLLGGELTVRLNLNIQNQPSGVETFDRVEKPEQAFQAALSFGHFQRLLLDFPATDLHDTIPDFHNTRRRFERFLEVLDADPADRASQIPEEVRFLKEHELEASRLLDLQDRGELPLRVTHNDTKLNNILFDGETGEGICVVDLDTVMPGLSLYDFGDLVRTAATTAAEDERDLNKVRMDIQLFRELVRGYLDALGGALEDQEIRNLAFSARLITMEIGMRFLTDFLEGDIYFKIHREGHNLDRARNQFQLVRSMEAQVDEMEAVVEKYR